MSLWIWFLLGYLAVSVVCLIWLSRLLRSAPEMKEHR